MRLTRDAGLLAPTPQVRRRAERLHEGRITVEVPDTLWATDATEAWTVADDRCAVFVIVGLASGGLIRRCQTDGPLRGRRSAARGLRRTVQVGRTRGRRRARAPHDGGSCFRSAHYQAEIDHLAVSRPPAFHYEPET